ncbi:MAG: hypothetical protein M3Z14_04115 [Candidatus Eremiobacteraeota bacterium]|nr:hypothetical protein [Candidatus Eremiobacteraeota bacterium]
MKMVLEVLLSLVLHPLAMLLMWLNLAGRSDLTAERKVVWFLVSLLWGLGPILYLLVDDGSLW